MSNEIIVTENNKQIDFSREKVEMIKKTVAIGSTDIELQFFIEQCKRTQLDPIVKQIYFIKDKNGKVQVQTSIDGLRLIASRSKDYEGQTKQEWCGKDGIWKDIWLDEVNPPAAARSGVYKKGFREALYAVALYSEYCQMQDEYVNSQKTGKKKPSFIWGSKPALMLSKVSEALALRKSFPNDMSGVYTTDEFTPEPAAPRTVNITSGYVAPVVSNVGSNYVKHVYDAPVIETKKSEVGSFEDFQSPVQETIIPSGEIEAPNLQYVCEIGKKYKGQTLEQIGFANANSFKGWLITTAKESGKPIEGKAFEYLCEVEKWSDHMKANNNS